MLSEAEVQQLTERFIFGDPSGPKASGPSRAASRATLRLVVTADKVRTSFWPSRRAEIKTVLADEQGRFDISTSRSCWRTSPTTRSGGPFYLALTRGEGSLLGAQTCWEAAKKCSETEEASGRIKERYGPLVG